VPTGRSVGGTTTAIVVVRASVVVGIVIRPITVRVMIATSTAGVAASRSVVVVTLAVCSRWHDEIFL